MRLIRTGLTLSLLCAASGCSILSGRCLYELRNAYVQNSISLGGTDSLSATVVEAEQRDYQPDKNMSWQILAPTLKGHVQQIVLLESATSTTPRYVFPLASPSIPPLSNGFVRQSEGANLNGFYDLLASGTAVIRITTDIPGRAQIDLVLSKVEKNDWNRPYCS